MIADKCRPKYLDTLVLWGVLMEWKESCLFEEYKVKDRLWMWEQGVMVRPASTRQYARLGRWHEDRQLLSTSLPFGLLTCCPKANRWRTRAMNPEIKLWLQTDFVDLIGSSNTVKAHALPSDVWDVGSVGCLLYCFWLSIPLRSRPTQVTPAKLKIKVRTVITQYERVHCSAQDRSHNF